MSQAVGTKWWGIVVRDGEARKFGVTAKSRATQEAALRLAEKMAGERYFAVQAATGLEAREAADRQLQTVLAEPTPAELAELAGIERGEGNGEMPTATAERTRAPKVDLGPEIDMSTVTAKRGHDLLFLTGTGMVHDERRRDKAVDVLDVEKGLTAQQVYDRYVGQTGRRGVQVTDVARYLHTAEQG